MKANKNPYRIPAQFPTIIMWLNRLSRMPDRLSVRGNLKIGFFDRTTYIVSSKKMWISHGGEIIGDVSGVHIGRFDIYIDVFLDVLVSAIPSCRNEIKGFNAWMRAEHEQEVQVETHKRLEHEAARAGYKLVRP